MGIKALNPELVIEFVSEHDGGYNAVTLNQVDIDAALASDKEPPEAQFQHSDDATKWMIGTLSGTQMAMITDDLIGQADGGMVLRSAENDTLAARIALRGWSNFTDDNGQPVAFTREKVAYKGRLIEMVSEDTFALIPLPIAREIGRKAKEANTISGVQAKNSVSAS